jgi:hypothetical protein
VVLDLCGLLQRRRFWLCCRCSLLLFLVLSGARLRLKSSVTLGDHDEKELEVKQSMNQSMNQWKFKTYIKREIDK